MKIADKDYLKPHNSKIVFDIESLINSGENSIFYSEATGLGKSFVFMKLVWDMFRDKKILYIVPKIVIYKNLRNEDGFADIDDRITMATYSSFNNEENIEYVVNNYDVIFADEAHHIASDIQGANIRKAGKLLCEKGGYFLGMTATPECLDSKSGNINVKQYFENAITGYNIIEAIENGLFPKIDYSVSILDEKIVPKEYRVGTNVDVNKLYLRNTIDKYSSISHWLVYFSNIAEMEKNKKYLEKYFPEYKILAISSENDSNYDEILDDYNSYEGKIMLLSVSVLLEGVHIRKTGGVILFRRTRSIRVLLQILGRICNIGRKESPVFIDMMSSIRNIKKESIIKSINKTGKSKPRKPILNISTISRENIDICEELYGIIDDSKYKTVLGYKFKSDGDLSLQLGYTKCYVYTIKRNNPDWTYEDIIRYATKDKYKTVLGYTFETDKDLSLQLLKKPGYVCAIKRNNPDWTYEDIIRHATKDKYKTVLGYTFKSNRDLSLQLFKYESYVGEKLRLNPDWTYEDVIRYAISDN